MAGDYDVGWNAALDEIASRVSKLPFGDDTIDSFNVWIKEFKRMPLNMTAREQERWLYIEGDVEQARLKDIEALKEEEEDD